MIFYELIRWWYGPGLVVAWRNVVDWPSGVSRSFSIPILLSTLFAPWRRIMTPPGSSIQSKVQAAGDNLVSRVIGMIVRFFVLITAALISLVAFAAAVLLAAGWVFVPAGVVFLIISGVGA